MNDRIQVQTADLKQFTLEGNVATSRIDDAAHEIKLVNCEKTRVFLSFSRGFFLQLGKEHVELGIDLGNPSAKLPRRFASDYDGP